jgi:2-keto-4-pentenoate hydratase/2-oxohepta-3-ene-1,7-dioic acid hydratase in catechol pathway
MKLASFTHHLTGTRQRFGVVEAGQVIDPRAARAAHLIAAGEDASTAANRSAAEIPADVVSFFASGVVGSDQIRQAVDEYRRLSASGPVLGADGESVALPQDEVRLLAPVPRPRRIRDYLTYEAHATGAKVAVPAAFSQMPICYKGNPDSVVGHGDPILWPSYTSQLDYELEVGFYVSREARNLSVAEAASAIGAVTFFNDVSARDIQLFEMSMTIGPSKGKDFCTPMGPYAVTMDELDENAIEVTARINGEVWSHGTTANRRYSFAEVLAWASFHETVYPGEFLAVGTIGGGCGLEIGRWLKPGDVVEFDSPQLGQLRNTVSEPEMAPPDSGLPSFVGAPAFVPAS